MANNTYINILIMISNSNMNSNSSSNSSSNSKSLKIQYNTFCNNCGKIGHLLNDCKNPITSIGIISFRYNTLLSCFEYLLIQRNDSFGFVEFIRGKYPLYNLQYLQTLINEMTVEEKNKLLTMKFEDMWKLLWGEFSNGQYRNEETSSKEKFEYLKKGVKSKDVEYNIESLIASSNTNWSEPEWGFPKGRRNYNETDLECSVREFNEESGFNLNKCFIVHNISPFEEIFCGSNYKSYKHKYFLTYMDFENSEPVIQVSNEISDIKWKSYADCIALIRSYNLEKKRMLSNIDILLKKTTLVQ